MIEITVQVGGWQRSAVAWLTAEAGEQPPSRSWGDKTALQAVQSAMAGLGLAEATVYQVADCDDQDGEGHAWGTVARLEVAS